jgi:hypothetical protein
MSLLRALYSRVAGTRPVSAIRTHPRVRALARRHVFVLLSRGRTWANVDGALRLLSEDRRQQVVFGPWRGDPLLEQLYWLPFVRWAQTHFPFAPEQVVADAHAPPGAAVFPPEPVLALVEEYRQGTAAPRPLLKRLRHAHLPPAERSAGGTVEWSEQALLGVLSGAPTIAILPEGPVVEPDLDLALRVAAELGESLTILSNTHFTRLLQALRGPGAELEWGTGP